MGLGTSAKCTDSANVSSVTNLLIMLVNIFQLNRSRCDKAQEFKMSHDSPVKCVSHTVYFSHKNLAVIPVYSSPYLSV